MVFCKIATKLQVAIRFNVTKSRLHCTIFFGGEPNIMYSAVMSNGNYHKVLSINTSCLEAHFTIYKMFMTGEFNLYLLSLVT